MLSKKIRLTTSLFEQVFKNGRVSHSERFWLRSLSFSDAKNSGFAVAVPKKVAATAVSRNRTKRIVYAALEKLGNKLISNFSGEKIIVGVKKDISQSSTTEIATELKLLLEKRPKIR